MPLQPARNPLGPALILQARLLLLAAWYVNRIAPKLPVLGDAFDEGPEVVVGRLALFAGQQKDR